MSELLHDADMKLS